METWIVGASMHLVVWLMGVAIGWILAYRFGREQGCLQTYAAIDRKQQDSLKAKSDYREATNTLVRATIDGMVLDIHFRMLQPHELAAAMSFPKTYKFTGTREEVVKQIGNSWAGELSKALCLSAVQDFAPKKRAPWRDEATA